MLSIRFDRDREWWVSASVLERLFRSAIENGHLAPALDEWQHVADANGGLSLASIDAAVANELVAGLRAAAHAEVERLPSLNLRAEDQSYLASLQRLLAVAG
jgi:hypothetical protein